MPTCCPACPVEAFRQNGSPGLTRLGGRVGRVAQANGPGPVGAFEGRGDHVEHHAADRVAQVPVETPGGEVLHGPPGVVLPKRHRVGLFAQGVPLSRSCEK